jgi:hypothetical protein
LVHTGKRLVACPKFISRFEWKARDSRGSEHLTYIPVPYIVIHHGGINQHCFDQITCSKIVTSYQNLHMDKNDWNDIGYNFLIGEDGNVYEGRGWDSVGAHAPGYNTQSIGVCLIGNFNSKYYHCMLIVYLTQCLKAKCNCVRINNKLKVAHVLLLNILNVDPLRRK